MIKQLTIATLGVAALAACSIDPKDYESDPVVVETAQGPVVCQLYTQNIVRWDRAIRRPDTMGVTEGDNTCLREGERRREAASGQETIEVDGGEPRRLY